MHIVRYSVTVTDVKFHPRKHLTSILIHVMMFCEDFYLSFFIPKHTYMYVRT